TCIMRQSPIALATTACGGPCDGTYATLRSYGQAPALRHEGGLRTTYNYYLRSAEAAAKLLGVELVPIPFDSGVESFAHRPDGGLFVLPDPLTTWNSDLIIGILRGAASPFLRARRSQLPLFSELSHGRPGSRCPNKALGPQRPYCVAGVVRLE